MTHKYTGKIRILYSEGWAQCLPTILEAIGVHLSTTQTGYEGTCLRSQVQGHLFLHGKFKVSLATYWVWSQLELSQSETVLKKPKTNEHNKFKNWSLSQWTLQISHLNPTWPVTTAYCRNHQGWKDIGLFQFQCQTPKCNYNRDFTRVWGKGDEDCLLHWDFTNN